jgi:flagellar hook-associated protein 2
LAAPLQSIGGLASGLDTNALIAQLMAVEQRPLVRLAQKQRLEEARQTALRDVETRLKNLQTKAQSLRDVGTWTEVQTVSSSDAGKVGVTKTGGPPAGSWNVVVDKLARAQQLKAGATPAAISAGDTLTFDVGATGSPVTVTLAGGESLDGVAAAINGTSGITVNASVVGGQLYVSSRTTGAANTVTVGGTLAAGFGFTETVAAQNAEYSVDGGPPVTTSATNTIDSIVPGLQIELKGITGADGVNVTVSALAPDKAAIKTKVQEFVDQYNSTIEFVRGKLNEKKVKDPQTESDRLKGILSGDAALSSLLGNLRTAIGDGVTGLADTVNHAADVGLTTGATTGAGTLSQDAISGKLTLDGSKLEGLLASNFADVKKLFTQASDAFGEKGIAWRVDSLLDRQLTTTTGILSSRLDSEASMIQRLKQQQTDFETRLELKERNFRRMFTSLETALAKSQQQGQWLSGQLAGLL